MAVEVRPFQRGDREQLTGLVNAHVAAVVPGVSVPVNAVLSQLEREPGEFIVDPWVIERHTLVAVERDAIVAGAHLLRYGAGDWVGDSYRDAAEIRWLVCWPTAVGAGVALADVCIDVMHDWGVSRQYADGSLPALATYGVPACWPHVREILVRAGFAPAGHVEVILVAMVDQLPSAGPAPLPGLSLSRSVGYCGTRFSALIDGGMVGMIEVETDMTQGGTRLRQAGWADIGNLCVTQTLRRRGIGTWLIGLAGDWLRLGRVDRVIDYAWLEHSDHLAFSHQIGFRELTRTERGWQRPLG